MFCRVQRFYHQPQIKSGQDPYSVGRTSTTCFSKITFLPSNEEPPLAEAPEPTTKETPNLSRSIKPSSNNCSKRQEVAEKWTEPDGHNSRDIEKKCRSQKWSESTDRKLRSSLHHNKDSEQKQADKDTRQGLDSWSHNNWKYQDAERHCRSDVAKTSSQELFSSVASSEHRKEGSKVWRTDKARTASLEHDKVPDYQTGDSCSSDYRKTLKCHRYERRSISKYIRSSSPEQSAKQLGDGTKERERKRQKDQRNVDRRCEDEVKRRHHRRNSLKENSRERENHRVKRSRRADGSKVGRSEKKPKDVKRSSEEPNSDANITVECDSERKLCFMETLNLTLSPIKRLAPPRDSSPEELQKDGSPEENSLPNFEDMWVIDEVENSQLDTEQGHVAEKSIDLKAPSMEQFNMEDNTKNVSQSPGKSLADPPRQLQDTAEDEGTVAHIVPSPNSCPLGSTNDKKHCEEQSVLLSTSQKSDTVQPVVTERSKHSNISPFVLEQHKSTEVQTSQPEDAAASAATDTGETPVPQNVPQGTVSEAAASPQSKGTYDTADMSAEAKSGGLPCHQASSPSVSPSSTSLTQENDQVGQPESSEDFDSVSSTICLNSLPQEGLSLTEAIYVMTQADADSLPSSSVGCVDVSKVSSTTEEHRSPEKCSTPLKVCRQDQNNEPSSSVSLPHDEDSMMHTLSNLKRIPEAISPLRSPVQMAKRSVLHVHSKLGHVKSLQKGKVCLMITPCSSISTGFPFNKIHFRNILSIARILNLKDI